MRVEVAVLNEPSGFRGRKAIIEPCFGIGLSLSLICQLTSEDIKQHYLPVSTDTDSGDCDDPAARCAAGQEPSVQAASG